MSEGFEFGWWYSQSERGGGSEGSGGAVGDKEVRQVGWGQVVESFEGQEEYFEVNALFDREPVEGVENGGNVLTGPGVSEEASSRVLDHLKSMEGMRGDASEEGVAVVKT